MVRPSAVFVVVCIAVANIATQQAKAAAGQALLQVVCEPLCMLSEELDGHPGAALNALDEQVGAIETMQAAQLRAAIYVAKGGPAANVKVAVAVITYFARQAQTAATVLKQTTGPKMLKAAAHATYLKGQIDEFLNIMANARAVSNQSCLATTSATIAAVDSTTIGGKACSRKLSEPTKQTKKSEQINDQGFHKLLAGADSGNGKQSSASTGCKILDGSPTGFADTLPITQAIHAAGGYVQILTSSTGVTLANLRDLATGSDRKPESYVNVFKSKDDTPKGLPDDFKNQKGKLSTRVDLLKATTKVILSKEGRLTKDGKEQLKNLLGEDTEQKLNAYLATIDNTDIPEGLGGNPKEQRLSQITDIGIFSAILTYYQLQNSDGIADLKKKLDEKATKNKG
ncbi:Trypanosome variant surface glycoprotein (A-type) [Trypanosoma brucei equiperdum]|uniref:Trypanosome variant surface glycoprotein (A-type) n=1 Tax=Trypanosoma brucei equiperdum TaxID=630700 RepID=A0A3L6KT99_9TRYP|nr:Trypanosome variant surface glycoprotein (A-type) [Trypanosoma brucei equiperdum]